MSVVVHTLDPHAIAAERRAEAARERCHFPGCGKPWASFGFDFGKRTFCRAHVVRGTDGRFEPRAWKATA